MKYYFNNKCLLLSLKVFRIYVYNFKMKYTNKINLIFRINL